MCACVWLGSSNLHSYKKTEAATFHGKGQERTQKTEWI